MKIVLVGPTYPLRGGIARYGTHLLGAMNKRHECLGVGFKKLYPSRLFPGEGQVELGEMPASGAEALPLLHYADPFTWQKALSDIRQFSPYCVVLTWWVPFWAVHLGWLARRLSRVCPVIFICHNVLPHESRWYDARMTRWTLKAANRFIVHSEDNCGELLNWFPEARVIRREHPIYYSDALPKVSRDNARRALGVKGRMLLFFGFVRPYKGLDVALEALARVGNDLEDVNLWVAGEFWEDEQRYRRQVDQLHLGDRVTIEAGYMTDEELALRLSACDGVVLPYRKATGSGVLASAYAMNRPVIATRTGCFKEMVFPGETGLLTEPGSSDGLAQAIEEFYSDGGPDRFSPGLERVRQRFTWDGIVDAVEELASDG